MNNLKSYDVFVDGFFNKENNMVGWSWIILYENHIEDISSSYSSEQSVLDLKNSGGEILAFENSMDMIINRLISKKDTGSISYYIHDINIELISAILLENRCPSSNVIIRRFANTLWSFHLEMDQNMCNLNISTIHPINGTNWWKYIHQLSIGESFKKRR